MKRISITIPDSLHKRYQLFKDEINISLIARQAIESEVKKIENWQNIERNYAALIEKFQMEKEDLMGKWEKEGFEAGQDWVKASSFSELEAYIQKLPELRKINELWPDQNSLTDYTDNYREDPEWTNTAAISFWAGFSKGAYILGKEILDKI